jgi:hypothetical protein
VERDPKRVHHPINNPSEKIGKTIWGDVDKKYLHNYVNLYLNKKLIGLFGQSM